MSFVTFIVPTLGRPALDRALKSLLVQTDDDWEAIVVFDQNKTVWIDQFESYDERFWPLYTKKGSAGETRNVGLDWFKSNGEAEWVAFLDDDDVVLPTYVEHLREHADDYPWADVVVFRMDHQLFGILPPPTGQLQLGTVGISFALRAGVAERYRFDAEDRSQSFHEDWQLISKLVQDQRQVFISPHIEYTVRDWRNG